VVFANSTGPSSIWLAEHGTNFITEYLIDSHNVIRYPTSSSPRHYITLPFWIAERADDKGFWFNEHEGNRIAFFNTTAMTLLEYEVPTRDPFNGYIANALTLSADPNDKNKVWFTEFNHDKTAVHLFHLILIHQQVRLTCCHRQITQHRKMSHRRQQH
jgi:hypothetical protein